MHFAVGTDIIPVSRMVALMSGGHGFRRWFTPAEADYCDAKRAPAQHYAARLAAKEAVVKALQERWDYVPYAEIEIRQPGREAPTVQLHGHTAEIAAAQGVTDISVSLSHCEDYATATALVLRAAL